MVRCHSLHRPSWPFLAYAGYLNVVQRRFSSFFLFPDMSILHRIAQKETWEAFYECKMNDGHWSLADIRELKHFIEKELFQPAVKKILAGNPLSIPVKKEISKIGKQKKRVVYTFKRDENLILKLLTHLLGREYDHIFSPNLYSFRVNSGVKKAIRKITGTDRIESYYSYKIDISDYFNSINIDTMLRILEKVFTNDKELYSFSQKLLSNPYVKIGKDIVEEKKGVMAGTPIAVFFSNLYLTELDKCFDNRDDIIYCRYSDDIILFTKEKELLEEARGIIFKHIYEKGLTVNPEKEATTQPGEEWTFLGFSYCNGVIDISHISKEKLKGKMRRKARALIRWKNRKGKEDNMAVRAFIKRFNKKLYDSNAPNETNWSRWYFPLINTDKSLKEIDAYMQECLRYTASETHTKARFNYRYTQMKALGYRCLVNEWYKWIKDKTKA